MKKIVFLLSLIYTIPSLAGFFPHSFQASMQQIYKSIRGERKDPIELFYKTGKLYFENKGPAKVVYICSKDKVMVYNPPFKQGEKGELKIAKGGAYCHSKLFDALANGLNSNEIYQVQTLGKIASLTFGTESSSNLQIKSVKLFFKSEITSKTTFNDVAKFEILKLDSERPIELIIQNIDDSTKIDESVFNFKPPAESTNIHYLK